jgi:hypothetical protein
MAFLFALVVILHSWVTGPIFLALTFRAYERTCSRVRARKKIASFLDLGLFALRPFASDYSPTEHLITYYSSAGLSSRILEYFYQLSLPLG